MEIQIEEFNNLTFYGIIVYDKEDNAVIIKSQRNIKGFMKINHNKIINMYYTVITMKTTNNDNNGGHHFFQYDNN